MLLLTCSFANANDYLNVVPLTTPLNENATETFEWYAVRECPNPTMIMGCSNGYVVTTTGNATWVAGDHNFTPFPTHLTIWNLGGLLFTDQIDGSGMFLTGGAAMPPAGGLPVFSTPMFWFSLDFTMGDLPDGSTGDQICFDSAFIPPAGSWKFSGMDCGAGGTNRPYALCDGVDSDQPCCFDVLELVCTDPDINVTPIGDLIEKDICGTATFVFGADPGEDGNDPATIVGWSVTAGIGTIDAGGNYSASVGPADCGVYDVTVQVDNNCGGIDSYNFQVEFVNALPSFTDCPDNCLTPTPVGQGNSVDFVLNVTDPDACQGLTLAIDSFTETGGPYGGTMGIVGNVLTVATIDGDGPSDLCITVSVTDDCGGQGFCDVGVKILTSEPFEVQIDKKHYVYQGHYTFVSIWLNKGSEYFGGFDFLVGYDQSALIFMGATLGADLDGCFEYFTYRFNWNGNCGGSCPSGLLRVVGIADLNNGPNHPDPLVCMRHDGAPEELVVLQFYVTNDRTFECMFAPIRFLWDDCGDNTMSSKWGDSLFLSRYVYNYEGYD